VSLPRSPLLSVQTPTRSLRSLFASLRRSPTFAVHAYRDIAELGDVHIDAYVDDEGCLWFHVRDSGHGLAPRPDSPGLGLGLGLGIISQTATEMAVRTPKEGGTEIIMQFAIPTKEPGRSAAW
jgi:serine/threonine-protein kinase RsbW/stage II sporulation protein AB (anti-sigma F factor)